MAFVVDFIPVTSSYAHRVELVFSPEVDAISQDCTGDIFFDENAVFFQSSVGGVKLKIEYRSVLIHAIARQSPEALAHIYCQIGDCDDEQTTELKIVPVNPLQLDQMFEELSKCASLHPDSDHSEDEQESQWFTADSDTTEFKLCDDAAKNLDNLTGQSGQFDGPEQ